MVELFINKEVSHHLLVMATSGTTAIKINKITIYSAYNLLKNTSQVGFSKDIDRFNLFKLISLYINS